MDKSQSRHLSADELLPFLDGEPFSDGSRAGRHLLACTECQHQLRLLQRGDEAYRLYRHHVLESELSPAAVDWKPLPNIRSEKPRRSFLQNYAWAIAAAFAFGIVIGVWYKYSAPPEADDVLARAEVAPQMAPPSYQMVMGGRPVLPAALPHVRALFLQASYNFDRPLDPRAFNQWRRRLPDAHDRVTSIRENGAERYYRVQTDSRSNRLHSAYLLLSTKDYQVKQSGFSFSSEQPIEISAAAQQPPSSSPAPRPAAPESKPEEVPATPEDELRVFAALDKLGVEAGQNVEVSLDRHRNRVVVVAGGLPLNQRQQLTQELSSLPRTVVQWNALPPRSPRPASREPESVATSLDPAARATLEKQAGGPQAFETLVSQSLEDSHALFAETRALTSLAREFSRAVESELTPASRQTLTALSKRRVGAMQTGLRRLHLDLAPLLQTLPREEHSPPAASWQQQAIAIHQNTRNLDEAVSRLSSSGAPPASPEQLTEGVSRNLQTVETLVAQIMTDR